MAMANVMTANEVVHLCPVGAVTACCGKTPFELPRTDRVTVQPELVTCHPMLSIDQAEVLLDVLHAWHRAHWSNRFQNERDSEVWRDDVPCGIDSRIVEVPKGAFA